MIFVMGVYCGSSCEQRKKQPLRYYNISFQEPVQTCCEAPYILNMSSIHNTPREDTVLLLGNKCNLPQGKSR